MREIPANYRALAAPILFFVLGMMLVALPEVGFFSAVPGDLGDARFNSIILEHLYQWVTGKAADLWSPQFFYPCRGALAFSDNHFGSGIFYVLSRACGSSREGAYQVWFLLAYVLNYWACFYSLTNATIGGTGGVSAAVGAFIFAFALPVGAQDGHAQLGYRFAIPLASVALWRFCSERDLPSLSAALLWVTLEFYCSIYLGYFLCLLLFAAMGAFAVERIWSRGVGGLFLESVVQPIRNATGRARRLAVAAGLISAAALTALLVPYYIIAHQYGFHRSPDEIALMLPRFGSYLIADHSGLTHWVGSWVTSIPMRWEHQLFIGIAPMALVLLGIISAAKRNRGSADRVFAWACLILFLLTLSVDGKSLYLLLYYLPGVDSIRAVSRIILVMLLPVAVLACSGCGTVLGCANVRLRNLRQLALAILLFSMIAEAAALHPSRSAIALWRARINGLSKMLPSSLGKDSILYVDSRAGERWEYGELDGMMLAQDIHVSTVNGYSGNLPPGFVPPAGCGTALKRLGSYARRQHISQFQFCDMKEHLVIVRSAHCGVDFKSAVCPVPYAGALPDSLMRRIDIRVLHMRDEEGDGLWVDVEIHNASDRTLPSLSTTNNPVRLSWHFRSLEAPEREDYWDPRWNLDNDVPPGGHLIQPVKMIPPSIPGKYVLEVSMVQDLVAWFDKVGMRVAVAPKLIVIDDRGQAVLTDAPRPSNP